jgi:predicted SnoaL-like aldol condensation-catalyzing enzyme
MGHALKRYAYQYLDMVVAGKIQEAYDTFVATDFIHHNQYNKGGRQDLLIAMKANHVEHPNKQFVIKHAYEDGSTVIMHSLIKLNPAHDGVAVIHIFRFKDEKIVELWDLGQPLMKDSPNENGMF